MMYSDRTKTELDKLAEELKAEFTWHLNAYLKDMEQRGLFPEVSYSIRFQTNELLTYMQKREKRRFNRGGPKEN